MNTHSNNTPKGELFKKQSRNDKNESKSKIEEYNKLIENYLDNKQNNNGSHNKDLLNKSANYTNNYLKTDNKSSNDLNSSNLRNNSLFRTQNKSNSSFFSNNEKSFVGKNSVLDTSTNQKNYRLNELSNDQKLPNLKKNDKMFEKFRNEKFPIIDNQTENDLNKKSNVSPFREFTFDKTFGKNSDVAEKMIITNDKINGIKKHSYNENNDINQIKIEKIKVNETNINKQIKDKPLKLDRPIQIEYNNSSNKNIVDNSNLKMTNNKNNKSPLNETKPAVDTRLLNSRYGEQNNSNELKSMFSKNIITSNNFNKDKQIVPQNYSKSPNENQRNKSKNDNSNMVITNGPLRNSELSNKETSNKQSVFASVNSPNYFNSKDSKISTNESKSVLGIKMIDPESIEEMHYLYVKFYQKSKQMMSSQENQNKTNSKVFLHRTVMHYDEIDLE